MAISKEILNNKKKVKSANTPKPLGTVPENNPEHVSAPVDFHHPIPPKPILYNSFEEAVNACEQIFLKPGEAHTEFYQKDETYHCVVAIGNIKPDTKHLYLTDSGNEMSIDDRLDNMSAQVTNLSKQFSLLGKKFDDLNNNVEEFENNVSTALNEIRTDITNFENIISQQINQVNTSINIFSEKIEDISNYVDSFDDRIQQNTNDISALTDRVGKIENWRPTVDTSINRLEELINGFEPIDTSSIRSLFHDDIWTVNLCCYTAGGHVEIFDDIAGEKWGGDSSRVAECTPFNEYKTYVEGDDVSFMAVANEGYKFVNWFYGDGHNIVNYADTSIINLEFRQSDIPVIGTLGENVNPAEPAILLNGYTAFFRKLHEVKWSIDTSCSTTQHLIEYFDDKIKVKITEKDRTSKEYIIDNNYTGKIYFDDGAKVEITALPSEDGRHTFEYYVLNESSQKTYNNPIIITNATDDIIVNTYFKEWWINIQTEPHPNVADIYVPEGSDMYHLREDILHINIENIQEDWQFEKWSDASISDIELDKYIIEGDLTTPDITVRVDASISSGKYDLIANFTQQEIHYYNVSFYSNNTLWHNELSVRQNTMLKNISVAEPSSTGYTFNGWMVDNVIEPDTYQINADTRFDASFGINQYNVTFYIDGELEEDVNVDYNTPFNTIEKPEHTKQGYKFLGWENAETGDLWQDDDITPIVEDSMFDAQYEINRYKVIFNVQDEIYDTSIVNWNTEFINVKPSQDPQVEGYVFKYWKWFGTDTSVLDTDLIISDSSFDAELQEIIYHSITLYDDPNYPTVPYYWLDNVLDGSTFSDALNMMPGYVDPSTMGPGYDFDGWEVEHTGHIVYPDHYNRYYITEDTSFYARYSIKKFNLTFQDNYGYSEQIDNVSYGETFGYVKTLLEEQPTPPEGYEFDYWAIWNGTSYIKMEDTSIIDGTYTIFNAIYKEIKTNYTIGFQTDNGNFILDGTDLVGKTLTYSTSTPVDPLLSDATFIGWYDNNGNLLTNASSYTFEVENENLPLQLNAKFIKQGEESTLYKKVVENGYDFNDNDLIVIGWQNSPSTYLLGNSMSATSTPYAFRTQIDGTADDINVDEENITANPAIQKIKLHKNENGNYALESIDSTGQQTSNLGFYYWTSGNSLSLNESITLEEALINSNYLWSISISNGEATIANLADINRKLQYNQGSPRFACYTSQQKIPSIFLLNQSQPAEYMNLGTYEILSDENAFTDNEQIIVTSHTNTTLSLNGWNDDATCIDATRTIIIGDTITSDWIFIPQYGNMHKAKFKAYDNNFTYFESTAQSDIAVDVDGYVDNNTIIEGSIGTPTHWIDNSVHPRQAQFHTLPFFDGNTQEQWYPSDHWVPVFTTSNYFTNFNKCCLTYCVNNDQTRGGAKIKMSIIDENDNEIAYAYGNGTTDGEVNSNVGSTLTELSFTNWYYDENGTKKLYKNTLNKTNIILSGKVRMYLKMNKKSLFITEFAINGDKVEN